jgi:hypothetical protein
MNVIHKKVLYGCHQLEKCEIEILNDENKICTHHIFAISICGKYYKMLFNFVGDNVLVFYFG